MKDADPEAKYEPFVLFVGRIEKQKGLVALIKTFEGTDYT